ncbi:D(1)-like dopamine receptor [Pseudolycoriella hygida]|uniref:D(1)-like dopamine receptor n=1 Tax=Pseudolycoriella hygida TaxID=35572 RepID=A0A9Q0MVD2_9DIPT|nr:D(1)-like dopamine receptor [Pseudolycoriella hygida]
MNSTMQPVSYGAVMANGSIRPSADRVSHITSDVISWAIVDGIIVIVIFFGNVLTILAITFSKKLQSYTSNMFVLSLAVSDLVVGLTLPYHLAFYMGAGVGSKASTCLMRFFLIIMACTVSIWNLISIAIDRYVAIVYPLHYVRYITRKVATYLITIGWIIGISIGLIPMFWNNWKTATECEFDEVLPPWYMAGVITPIFSTVWICMLLLYVRICREASKHVKLLRSSFSSSNDSWSDWKSVQMVLLIMGCFTVCWLPYFVVACAQIFKFLEESSPTIYKAAFSLAMANSGMNPIIYSWKNSNFRGAFSCLLRCKSPNNYDNFNDTDRSTFKRNGNGMHQHAEKTSTEISKNCMMANNNNSVNARVESIDKIENLSQTFTVIVHSTGKVVKGNLIASKFDIVNVDTTHDDRSK